MLGRRHYSRDSEARTNRSARVQRKGMRHWHFGGVSLKDTTCTWLLSGHVVGDCELERCSQLPWYTECRQSRETATRLLCSFASISVENFRFDYRSRSEVHRSQEDKSQVRILLMILSKKTCLTDRILGCALSVFRTLSPEPFRFRFVWSFHELTDYFFCFWVSFSFWLKGSRNSGS